MLPQWVLEKFKSALHLTPAHSDPQLTERIKSAVSKYFEEVTRPEFLDELASLVESETRTNFAKGEWRRGLKAVYEMDKSMEHRAVKLTGHTELESRWDEILQVCKCQALPNRTIGAALTSLGMKRFGVLRHVSSDTTYSVCVEPSGINLRIRLALNVTLSSEWQSEEILFHHVFVVTDDGNVVKIEKTTVSKVEEIALDTLE